jgi:hypothetical protein
VSLHSRNLNPWRRPARLAVFGAVTVAAWVIVARAQTDDASLSAAAPAAAATSAPYALFQYSSLTGSGNTITASWVPVVTAAGATIYKNVTLQFNVDAAGNLTLVSGFPKVFPAPIVQVSSFVSGNYVGPSGVAQGKNLITVSGPGVISGGSTEWSLAASPGAYPYTYPASATWYVGALSDSPLAARLQAAKITSTAWSYGVVGSAPWTIDGGKWFTNSLIGVSQIGNTLTIVDFTDNNSVDHNVPQDQITYTMLQ